MTVTDSLHEATAKLSKPVAIAETGETRHCVVGERLPAGGSEPRPWGSR